MPRLVVFLFNYHLEPGKTVAETRTVWLVMGADTRLSTAGPSGQAVLRAGWMLGARSPGEDSSHSSGPSALTRRLPGPADFPADAWGQRASGSRGACSDQLPAAARWAAGVGTAGVHGVTLLWGLLLTEPLLPSSKTWLVLARSAAPLIDSLCLLFRSFPRLPPPSLASSRLVYFPSSLRPGGWLTLPVPSAGRAGRRGGSGEAERRSRTGSWTGCIWDSTGNSPVCCLQSGCVPRRPLSFPRAVLIF